MFLGARKVAEYVAGELMNRLCACHKGENGLRSALRQHKCPNI
jgi:hypothetical protein